jgi:hypothetical protein
MSYRSNMLQVLWSVMSIAVFSDTGVREEVGDPLALVALSQLRQT